MKINEDADAITDEVLDSLENYKSLQTNVVLSLRLERTCCVIVNLRILAPILDVNTKMELDLRNAHLGYKI